ncbi:HAMP domain-containing sensor histidine kinase [Micromonospora sonneratiae]
MLLAVTYVLVEQRLPGAVTLSVSDMKKFTSAMPQSDLSQVNAAELRRFLERLQTDVRQNTLDSLLTQGGIALMIVSAAAIAFGWLIAGRALQPLHQITETAHRIAGADTAGRGLHERIALAGPRDEVRKLADTFDLMLERLDRSFDGQRRFVANASHELRTPLAINRSLIELAITRPGAPSEVRQLGEALLTVNERHERLIDGLLTLADSETELAERVAIDLAEVVGYVMDQATGDLAVRATRGLTVDRDLAPAAVVGDPILLERLVHNLLENAVRHNTPGTGWVSARTGVVDGRATLVVANTGPVVPGYDVETIFLPFRRLRNERLSDGQGVGGRGFGLGLSIVRAVARAHGGSVEARPRDGGGLTVTVSLPAGS